MPQAPHMLPILRRESAGIGGFVSDTSLRINQETMFLTGPPSSPVSEQLQEAASPHIPYIITGISSFVVK